MYNLLYLQFCWAANFGKKTRAGAHFDGEIDQASQEHWRILARRSVLDNELDVFAYDIVAFRARKERVVSRILALHVLHGQLDGIACLCDAKAIRVLDGHVASGPTEMETETGNGNVKWRHQVGVVMARDIESERERDRLCFYLFL